jgi:hypothetical protein
MEKLKKHICIRLTGEQFRKLADVLVDEQMSKSVLLRNLIHDFLESHFHKTKGDSGTNNMKITEENTRRLNKIDEIFPIGEFRKEEVKFIENIIDKIHFDIECEESIILSTKGLISLIIGVLRLSKEKPQ